MFCEYYVPYNPLRYNNEAHYLEQFFLLLFEGLFSAFLTEKSNKQMTNKILTLIRVFSGPSPSVFSGKKSKIISGDVTVGT